MKAETQSALRAQEHAAELVDMLGVHEAKKQAREMATRPGQDRGFWKLVGAFLELNY